MNKNSLQISLSNAVIGFLIEKEAERLSDHTLLDYKVSLRRAIEYLGGDTLLHLITAADITRFMAYLGTTTFQQSGCAPREAQPLSNKTLRNHHTALSSLWTWAVAQGYTTEHIVRQVPRPKAQRPPIDPFSERDILALLAACSVTATYTHHKSKSEVAADRATSLRDLAILYLLLDTGVRASELCGLTINDVDFKQRHIEVLGKGNKRRIIPFSAETGRALFNYFVAARSNVDAKAPFFLSIHDDPLTRNALQKLIKALGKRAKVRNAHPHRFRHTFAIMYLRNGGNIYSLKRILGHTTLDMVETYLTIVQADVDNAHATASPVANLRRHPASE